MVGLSFSWRISVDGRPKLRFRDGLVWMAAKHYLYTASRKEQEFYFEALLAILKNEIKIEKQKSKSQINM